MVGATGRLGESLLNAVIARGGYREIAVLTERPVNLATARLVSCTVEQLGEVAADDAFVLLADPTDAQSRSFHGRDAPFVLAHAGNAAGIAQAALAQRRLRRIALVSPMPAWHQFGSLRLALDGPVERAFSALPLETLVIARPVRAASSRGQGIAQRVANVYLSLQMLAMPRSIPALSAEQVARAVVNALARDVAGLSILSAVDLAALATAPGSIR